jgi:hypothetical protein
MIDYRDYLTYAEKYTFMAHEEASDNINWLLIPATILAWSSIECFINNMLDDFNTLPADMFELHERAFLLEKGIKFISKGSGLGQFALEGSEYRRLEEKIFFLIAKMNSTGSVGLKGSSLWQEFEKFKSSRDTIVHPSRSKELALEIQDVEEFIATAKSIITFVGKSVWNKEIVF